MSEIAKAPGAVSERGCVEDVSYVHSSSYLPVRTLMLFLSVAQRAARIAVAIAVLKV